MPSVARFDALAPREALAKFSQSLDPLSLVHVAQALDYNTPSPVNMLRRQPRTYRSPRGPTTLWNVTQRSQSISSPNPADATHPPHYGTKPRSHRSQLSAAPKRWRTALAPNRPTAPRTSPVKPSNTLPRPSEAPGRTLSPQGQRAVDAVNVLPWSPAPQGRNRAGVHPHGPNIHAAASRSLAGEMSPSSVPVRTGPVLQGGLAANGRRGRHDWAADDPPQQAKIPVLW